MARLILFALFFAVLVAAPSARAAATHAAAPAAASDAPAVQKVTQAESYIMVEPIYASILDGVMPRGLLLVEVSLDVPDEALRGQVGRALPLLRDAYLRNMLVYAANAVRPWKQPNVEDVATRLQAITDAVMGRPGARLLLAQVAVRLTR